jgi:hypothetical protein
MLLNIFNTIYPFMSNNYQITKEEVEEFLQENPEMITEIKETGTLSQEIVKKPLRKPRITVILHQIELTKLDDLKRKYKMSRNEILTRLIQRAKL